MCYHLISKKIKAALFNFFIIRMAQMTTWHVQEVALSYEPADSRLLTNSSGEHKQDSKLLAGVLDL